MRERKETLEDVHASGGLGTGQGGASNRDGEAGQNTDRALFIFRVKSSLLFCLDHCCSFGDAGGEGALKEYELNMFCLVKGVLGSLR